MQSTQNARLGKILRQYQEELEHQSLNPPGKDPVIASCYLAFSKMLKSTEYSGFIEDIIAKRHFTPTHFVNLFFRAIQYIELYNLKNEDYPQKFFEPKNWQSELRKIIKKDKEVLEEILLTRDTTTTIFQRYAGSKIVLNALFPNEKLKIADFGCGGNYGIPGLSKNLEFDHIEDLTEKKTATKLISHPIKITKGIAIDKEDPKEVSAKAWRLACSFYPKELSDSIRVLILEAEVSDAKHISFIREDVLKFDFENHKVTPNSFDAVIMSTFLYQLRSAEQKKALEQAQKFLNGRGIIIVQDFIKKHNKNKCSFSAQKSWFSKPFLYKTYIIGNITDWKIKEVLKWDSGRCRIVKPGRNFDILL